MESSGHIVSKWYDLHSEPLTSEPGFLWVVQGLCRELSALPPQLTLGPRNFQILPGMNWSWDSWMLLLPPSTEHVFSCARVPGYHILLCRFCIFDDASIPGCYPGLCQHPSLHPEDQEHVSEDHVQIWDGKEASDQLTHLCQQFLGKRLQKFCYFICFFNRMIF